ncbi:DNA-3-methyladenine glycosylase 2 family protein [Ktedonosporobacter rubrisoli]|uniref:DNA-3-methyladenine glycosylase II n=2 Tax=Ktedonosporobacter rubrisoli TaxID=2509675 RepID=A0A4P6K5I1_KTERU|nr:DNA-3-methyladenine glycosylase 2 family protein [Ktedonosporobacter rubrisoli]
MQTYTDFDLCYKALCSRDSRFDGRFFAAVTTTGIYCRPICPAPTPYAKHVRFFTCAAAAEAAGFRACRRCHPEASPGSPEWNMRADLVARALRLIADGVVDTEGVSGLAQRLAVSERHLHRELMAEVGVGPLALARTRRAQTARLLIDQTNLSLTTIAFTAGFASIRQFNETMQTAFGCAPSAFRRSARPEKGGEGKLTLRLQYRPPFEAGTLLSYLGQRAVNGVEEVKDGCYRRTVILPASQGVIELEPMKKANAVQLRLQLTNLNDLSMLVQRCRQLFDLDMVPEMISNILAKDSLLTILVAQKPGLRIPGALDGFELAVRAILGQQISVAGARTLAGRLVAGLGVPLEQPQSSLTHFFPSAQVIANADLQGYGLTNSRITALKALASAVAAGDLVLDRSADYEVTKEQLLKLPGIGPWTVAYIVMRVMGDPDAFPVTDLALRRALEHLGVNMSVRDLEAYAEAWRPWRAYATHYLWANLAASPARNKAGSQVNAVSDEKVLSGLLQ